MSTKQLTDRQIKKLASELEVTFKQVDDMEDFFFLLKKKRLNFVDYYVSKNTPFKTANDKKKFEDQVRVKIQRGLMTGNLKKSSNVRDFTVKFNWCHYLYSYDLSKEFQELYDFATTQGDIEKNGNSRGKRFDELKGSGVVYLLIITRPTGGKKKTTKKKVKAPKKKKKVPKKKITKKKSNITGKKRKRDENKSKKPKKKQKTCRHSFGDPTLQPVKGGKFLAVSSCSKCGEISSKTVS